MAKAADRPAWTPSGEISERCPGLSLILGYKPKVDLTDKEQKTALLTAVKDNGKDTKYVVQLLVSFSEI